MAEIKVLALDLDGTLTNDQKEVTPRTRAALDAAIERGVTVVLASGRPTADATAPAFRKLRREIFAFFITDILSFSARLGAVLLFLVGTPVL